jgi:hypothetical protein
MKLKWCGEEVLDVSPDLGIFVGLDGRMPPEICPARLRMGGALFCTVLRCDWMGTVFIPFARRGVRARLTGHS